jgi:hypothetical protein
MLTTGKAASALPSPAPAGVRTCIPFRGEVATLIVLFAIG